MLIVLPASRESGFSGSGSTINARGNLNSPTGNISDRPTNLAVSVGFHAGAGVVGGKEVPLPQKQDHRTVGPINPLTVPVGLNEEAKCFAGATVDPHTRTVGHNGRPSGVWGPGGRPRRGRAAGLPFPIAAECAGGAQRVKVEHPPGRQAHPPCLTLTRGVETATIARQGKGADTQPPTPHPHQPPDPAPQPALAPTPAPQHRPTIHTPDLLGSTLGYRGIPMLYPSEGRPLKVIISRRCLF